MLSQEKISLYALRGCEDLIVQIMRHYHLCLVRSKLNCNTMVEGEVSTIGKEGEFTDLGLW